MLRALQRLLNDWRFKRAFGDLNRREAEARRLGVTQAIGAVRRERRERLHAALAGPSGWRGRA